MVVILVPVDLTDRTFTCIGGRDGMTASGPHFPLSDRLEDRRMRHMPASDMTNDSPDSSHRKLTDLRAAGSQRLHMDCGRENASELGNHDKTRVLSRNGWLVYRRLRHALAQSSARQYAEPVSSQSTTTVGGPAACNKYGREPDEHRQSGQCIPGADKKIGARTVGRISFRVAQHPRKLRLSPHLLRHHRQ